MKLVLTLSAVLALFASTGCVPVAIGAAGAVVADTVAEDNGGDLF